MKLRFHFIRETADARLYRNKAGEEFWVPRSVIERTLKWPAVDLSTPPVHELEIEDWWCEKNKIP